MSTYFISVNTISIRELNEKIKNLNIDMLNRIEKLETKSIQKLIQAISQYSMTNLSQMLRKK